MPLFYFAGVAGVYFYGRYVERGAVIKNAVGGSAPGNALANILLTAGAGYAIYRGLKHA